MSETKIFYKEFVFEASPAQVWDLLVNPDKTRQYMYGSAIQSDWEIGSPVNWVGPGPDGQEVLYVKGFLEEYEEGKKLRYTLFPPMMDMEDIPENYLWVCYQIEETPEGSLLKWEQGDFAKVALGEKRYEDTISGWEEIVPAMKKVLGL